MSNIDPHGRSYQQTMPRFSRAGEEEAEWRIPKWKSVYDNKGKLMGMVRTLGEAKYNENYYEEIRGTLEDCYAVELGDSYWNSMGHASYSDINEEAQGTCEECEGCKRLINCDYLVAEHGSEDMPIHSECMFCDVKDNLRNMDPAYYPRLYDREYWKDKPTEEENETYMKQIVNKIELNYYIKEEKFDIQWCLENYNKRKMKDCLNQLKEMNDDPNTLLGRLCIRYDALELFPEWDATDFPHLNTK